MPHQIGGNEQAISKEKKNKHYPRGTASPEEVTWSNIHNICLFDRVMVGVNFQ